MGFCFENKPISNVLKNELNTFVAHPHHQDIFEFIYLGQVIQSFSIFFSLFLHSFYFFSVLFDAFAQLLNLQIENVLVFILTEKLLFLLPK